MTTVSATLSTCSGVQETDDVGEARIGLRLAVRGAEAAAHREVEAEQRAFLEAFVVEMAMKPRSCENTSTSLCGGTTMPVLNLRGR